MKVLTLYSMKGGVGKSTIAVNISVGAARAGRRVVLIDLDPQAAASYYLNTRPAKKLSLLDLLPKRADLAEALLESDYEGLMVLTTAKGARKLDVHLSKDKHDFTAFFGNLAHSFDLAVVDSPPQIGVLSERLFTSSDTLLVPVIPAPLSGRTYEYLIDFFERKRLPVTRIAAFFSMVRPRLKTHQACMMSLRSQFPGFLESTIPFSADIERTSVTRRPVLDLSARHVSSQHMQQLVEELLEKGFL